MVDHGTIRGLYTGCRARLGRQYSTKLWTWPPVCRGAAGNRFVIAAILFRSGRRWHEGHLAAAEAAG